MTLHRQESKVSNMSSPTLPAMVKNEPGGFAASVNLVSKAGACLDRSC